MSQGLTLGLACRATCGQIVAQSAQVARAPAATRGRLGSGDAVDGALAGERIQLAGGVLAERRQRPDVERLRAHIPRLAGGDPQAPDSPAAVVAEDVAPALRGPRLAAVDVPAGDRATPAVVVLEDGEHEPTGR